MYLYLIKAGVFMRNKYINFHLLVFFISNIYIIFYQICDMCWNNIIIWGTRPKLWADCAMCMCSYRNQASKYYQRLACYGSKYKTRIEEKNPGNVSCIWASGWEKDHRQHCLCCHILNSRKLAWAKFFHQSRSQWPNYGMLHSPSPRCLLISGVEFGY